MNYFQEKGIDLCIYLRRHTYELYPRLHVFNVLIVYYSVEFVIERKNQLDLLLDEVTSAAGTFKFTAQLNRRLLLLWEMDMHVRGNAVSRALFSCVGFAIVTFSTGSVLALPIEQELIQTKLQGYLKAKDPAGSSLEVNKLKSALKQSSITIPEQKVKAEILFSKALSSQELAALASRYGLEVTFVEFTTFSRSSEEKFTSGFFNLASRYDASLPDKLSHFENKYLEKLLDRMKRGWTSEEKEVIEQGGFTYFSMVVYGEPSKIVRAIDDPVVNLIPWSKDLLPNEYTNYQRMQLVWKEAQEKAAYSVPVVTLQGGADLPYLDEALSTESSAQASPIKVKSISPEEDVSNSDPFQTSGTNPSPIPCNTTSGPKGCPATDYWRPDKGSLGVEMRVSQNSTGFVTGYVNSYQFVFSNLRAFKDTSYVYCSPDLSRNIFRPVGAPCTNANSVYVEKSGYEHEAVFPNPSCTTIRGVYDLPQCFIPVSGFTNLPSTYYIDTPVSDLGTEFNAAIGTTGGANLQAGTYYQVNVDFQAQGEDVSKLLGAKVTMKGQISTDIPNLASKEPAYTQFAVRKIKLGEFTLNSCGGSGQPACPPIYALPAYTQDTGYTSRGTSENLIAGQTYKVIVAMQNEGTNGTWTTASNYKLGSENPRNNGTWGVSRVALPATVEPGGLSYFSFNITTPTTPGTYNYQWGMLQENVSWFGDLSRNTRVKVTTAGGGWTALPGKGTDIGIGSYGSTWLIGTTPDPSGLGYGIYYWNGSSWTKVSGAAVRVAVEPDGTPWVANNAGTTFKRVNGSWQQLPGYAKDIGISASGRVWKIGTTPVNGGYSVHYWNGSDWTQVSGGGVRIAVAPDGTPWIVNNAGTIFKRVNGSWQQLPGSAKDIGIGADGSIWISGKTVVNGNYGMYQWNGSSWIPVYGIGTSVSVAPDGTPWVINSSQGISRRN